MSARRLLDSDCMGRSAGYWDRIYLVRVLGRPMDADQRLIDQSAQDGAQMRADDGNPEEIGDVFSHVPEPVFKRTLCRCFVKENISRETHVKTSGP
jgi:hypothetical protein